MRFFWSTRGGENRVQAQIDAIEKAVEGLESRLKLMRGEWEEVHDRVNRVMGRLNARIRKVGSTEAPEDDAATTPQAVPPLGHVIATHGDLLRRRR